MDDTLQTLLLLWLATKILDAQRNVLEPAGEWLGNKAFDATHPFPAATTQHRGIDVSDTVYHYAQRAGFPNPAMATAIALAESGGNPNAIADTPREYSVGLWQINLRAHPRYTKADMLDPTKNAAIAYELSKHGTDWTPWSTYKNGAYKRYLK